MMLDTPIIHAPELPAGLRWLNGPPQRLQLLRQQGKVVLLDFLGLHLRELRAHAAVWGRVGE